MVGKSVLDIEIEFTHCYLEDFALYVFIKQGFLYFFYFLFVNLDVCYIFKSRHTTSDLVVLFSNISIGNNGIDLLSFNGY